MANRDLLIVVDDSQIDLAILNEIFKSSFRVKCISAPKQASAFIKEHHEEICLILLDIYLGHRQSGFSLLEDLQRDANTSSLPIILITSDANKEYVVSGMEAGAVDFLAKPVNPHTVQKRVYDIIRQYWPAETLFLSKQTNSSADEAFSLVPETLNAKQMLSALRPWRESLSLLCSLRPGLSFEKMKRTANIVSALAKTYASYCNTPPLSDNDAVWISLAASFFDIGLVALPDDVLQAHTENTYQKHTELGAQMFETSASLHPFFHHAADICRWHHKDYDGAGWPVGEGGNNIPLSAQLTRTAILCVEYAQQLGENATSQHVLRLLQKDVGYAISDQMYENACLCPDRLLG